MKKLSHIFVNGFFIMPATLYLTLLLFGTEKLVFIAPLLILSYTVIKYSCRLFIAMGIMTLIMFPVGTLNKNVPENEYVGTVVAISNYGFMLNNKNSVYVFSDVEVRLGWVIKIEGTPVKNTADNFSDLSWITLSELQNKNYSYSNPSVEVISSRQKLSDRLKENVNDELAFVLFGKVAPKYREFRTSLLRLGMMHYLVISSLHLILLFVFIEKIIRKFVTELPGFIIKLILIFVIFYFLGSSPSLIKASTIVLLKSKIIKIGRYQKLLLALLIVILLNPESVYGISLPLTFGMSFIIYESQYLTKKNKVFLLFVTTTIIQIILQFEFGLFNILIGALLWPLIIFMWISAVFNLGLFMPMGVILKTVEDKSIFITVGAIGINNIVYAVLILIMLVYISKFMFKRYVKMLLVIQLLFIPMQKFSQSYIVFINVGQGDSVLINHKTVTLIDTGGSYSKDLATEVLIPFLKYEGVNKIDRLIITHNDFDHSGAANSLESNFNVVSRDEEYLLPLPNYGNENDDSKVYYRVINGIGILLLADISKDVERDLIRMYPDLKVDVVKIAHHGSSTSTSEEMIKEYRPQTAVLSYGRNNYGHPSSDVINVLAKYKVETYHTYLHGSIKINLNTKKISTSNVV